MLMDGQDNEALCIGRKNRNAVCCVADCTTLTLCACQVLLAWEVYFMAVMKLHYSKVFHLIFSKTSLSFSSQFQLRLYA